MRGRDLARYHDIAATTKVRGAGIGFAGAGVKIALLTCAEVITETRRGKQQHVASSWRLASRHKAPWRRISPPGLVSGRGTAVRLVPTNALSPLLDPGFIEGPLQRDFQPLLDPAFDGMLCAHYPPGVAFPVNAQLAVDPAKEHAFVVAFLSRWGEAIDHRQSRRRRPGR